MKSLSKALVAVTLLTSAAALHAQTYYATDFSGYSSADQNDPTGPTLIGQNGWTGTGSASTFQVFNDGGTPLNTFVQIGAGNGGGSATHALNGPTDSGFVFNTDVSFYPSAPGTPNTYSFDFSNGGANVFSLTFAPSGTVDGTPTLTLTTNGLQIPGSTTTVNGPPLDGSFQHLTISVTDTGAITAFIGAPNAGDTITGTDTLADVVDSVGFSEADTGTGNDIVLVDNISVVVPEPSTYATMCLGLLGTLGLMKFRRRAV